MVRSLFTAIALLAAIAGTSWWAGSMRQRGNLADTERRIQSRAWSPENVQAVVRGGVSQLGRSLAILTWAESQTYFHAGFDLTMFAGPSDEEGHERHDHDDGHEHEDDVSKAGDLEIHTPEEVRKIRSVEDHPLLRRSPMRPYVFEHKHDDLAPKRMMPWYWLTTTLDPTFVRAYTNGSYWLAFQFHKVDEALKYIERGLHSNPDHPQLLAARGHIYFSIEKKYAAAISDYESAIEKNPGVTEEERDELIEWHRYLARAYMQIGDNDAAIQVAYRSKRIDPNAVGTEITISDATKALEGYPE